MVEHGTTPVSNKGGSNMQARFSYNRLWKLLIDKGMNKQTLCSLSGVSPTSLAKLGKGANVTTDIILKICLALDCDTIDVMEIVNRKDTEPNNE